MFNLLPIELQNRVNSEYRTRIAALACFVIAVEIILAAVGGVFSYNALSNVSTSENVNGKSEPENSMLDSSDLNKTVSETKEMLALLSAPATPLVSSAFSILSASRSQGISLTAFDALFAQEGSLWKIKASGIAANRESLAAFEKKLKSDRRFLNVTLPVESYAKDKNASFTIEMSYKELQ